MGIVKILVDGVTQEFVTELEEGEKEVNKDYYDNDDTLDLKEVVESINNSGDFNEWYS